ncbi:MAG TPA: hypothetical protein VL463_12820 [Kofleriaceae bacterium]|nr:hypothetical protein [Kofleriaceae bacterium]
MKLVRKIHFYLGTFFAPSIIFFAFTGMLQIYGFHEGDREIGWVSRLAEVHKIQSFDPPRRREAPAPRPATIEAAKPAPPSGPPPSRGAGPVRSAMLQLFFALMAISLIVSSCLGVWMAIQYKRDRRVIIGLLAAGVILPILFLAV